MRIAVYGATGMVGSRVVAEALSRGHEVLGITRSGGDLPEGARAVTGDAGDPGFTKQVAADADVVVSAIGPSRTGGRLEDHLDNLCNLVDTLGDARLVVVGGAGSLLVDGQRLLDRPDFPDAYKAEAAIGADALDYLRTVGNDVEWTFLSPAPVIQPGERTGSYRVSLDTPAGDSVSAEDYAVALVDEIERPAHRRTRFTVAN
jgi:putative NADH-flavin reductase